MPTRDEQDEQRAPHGPSVAQKLAWVLVLACSCSDEPTTPPIDPNDIDGDGIPNEIDLCPNHIDPLQHDEDGDRRGDRCDVCPTVADPLQEDTNEVAALQFEDGVGDECDPRPARGGDKISALHTFANDNGDGWIGDGWTLDADRVIATATAKWQHRQNHPGGAVGVLAMFSTVTWSVEGKVSLLMDGDGVSAGLSCAIYQDRDDDGSDELEVIEIGADPTVVPINDPIVPDQPFLLMAVRAIDATNRGIVDCVFRQGELTRSTRIRTADVAIAGQYAFTSDGAQSEVTSVIVYTAPQPCPDEPLRACPR